MPTDRATIFFVTERPGDEKLPLRGVYLTDIWHGQGLHRRAVRELQSPVAKACWLKGPQLVRVMIQRLLMAFDSQNEAIGSELTTEPTETDYPILVIDFTSGDVRQMLADDCESQTATALASRSFATSAKMDCGKPEKDE